MSSYVLSETDPNFSVSMNETDWEFDENNILKSVLCYNSNDNEGEFIPVTWDKNGAYVSHNGEKIYVLEQTA
ncbi:MAG: hypothetical protein NC489_21135 [Ruminococcus flavefaciens]|nr:hypothetical protein [Ruminococcus flavefaciens]